ncbi:hypothetical protein HPG69_012295, partial [Diceros bicornis minor]
VDPPQLINSGGPSLTSALTFALPTGGRDNSLLTDLGWVLKGGPQQSGKSALQKPLHYECLCAEPHQTPRRYLWAPTSGLPAGPGSAAAQGSPALPVQAVAAQSRPGVPVPLIPLVLWAQSGGRKERDGGFQKDEELQQMMKWVEKFPCASPHWLWGSEILFLVYDPDYMKVIQGRSGLPLTPLVLPKLSPIVPLIPSLDPTHTSISGLGYGLLLLNGQTCFQHRRMLTSAFHYDILKPYVGLMADSIRVMLVSPSLSPAHTHTHHNSQSPLQTHVSLRHPSDTGTQNNIMRQSSPKVDGTGENSQAYNQAVGDLNNLTFSQARNVFYQNDIIYRLTPNGRWSHCACQLAHQHTDWGRGQMRLLCVAVSGHPDLSALPGNHCSGTDQVVKLRKSHLQKEGELEKVRKKRHLDFLDILLFARGSNGSSLSDEDLRAEVDTFMFEGHDTTASSISWILYALAAHPDPSISRGARRRSRASWGVAPPSPGECSRDGRAMPTHLEKPLVSRTLPALQDGLGFHGPPGPDALHHHVRQGGTATLSTSTRRRQRAQQSHHLP